MQVSRASCTCEELATPEPLTAEQQQMRIHALMSKWSVLLAAVSQCAAEGHTSPAGSNVLQVLEATIVLEA